MEEPDQVQTLADLERLALSRVNKITREYWAHGAGENITVRENATAFDQYRLRPRVLRDVRAIDMTTTVLGQRVALPVGIASSGWHKMAHPDGEAATAAAARALGTLMGVSMGTLVGNAPRDCCSPEDVQRAGGGSGSGAATPFFQLYMFDDRALMAAVLRRVEQAGYRAVLLTVDSPYVGKRVSEIRNRPQLPSFLTTISFGTLLTPPPPADGQHPTDDPPKRPPSLNIDAGLVWEEVIPWLRQATTMQIWLKGVMTAEDARLAVKHGIDGIVVSNHGGRQLDLCVPTLDALPEVVVAVGGAIPVHIDGGVRRGEDVFRALALGADFVWVGRPALWGLAYDGQRGVERMLTILREELKLCMGLTGCASLRDITTKSLRLVGTSAKL
ncbi:Alpha-hydroxy acid dehydrogenase, FMN-dependent [Niveomyces insectorum RCEF 264]|uniref:Oxidase FUB9 n=1 Tax=Niveomyces insectorum RCEF 264 TaxID=1081102 RepID=A0A167QF19_9HYPO|nr:Alpha-hydroxy acid dehydrogenase, FMN-dependent [Niveomyces insectorum RCEF 264]